MKTNNKKGENGMQNFEKMTKNSLLVVAKNLSYMNERNEEKIRLLTGCSGFGDYDPMNGSCVDCSINNEKQWTKCREFKEKLHDALNEKWEEEKKPKKKEVEFFF